MLVEVIVQWLLHFRASSSDRGDGGGSLGAKRGRILTAMLVLSDAMCYGLQLDDVSRWAALAASECVIFPNIVYTKANRYDLKLDVMTVGPPTQPRRSGELFFS